MTVMTPESNSGAVRLGPLEQRVMEALWDHGALTVRGIIEVLGNEHAYSTIATVLGNLERKNLTVPQREGRAVQYTATCSRDQHAARLMEHALATSHDRGSAILHFVDAIAPSDLLLLRAYLDEQSGRP